MSASEHVEVLRARKTALESQLSSSWYLEAERNQFRKEVKALDAAIAALSAEPLGDAEALLILQDVRHDGISDAEALSKLRRLAQPQRQETEAERMNRMLGDPRRSVEVRVDAGTQRQYTAHLIEQARREYRDSDAAGDVLDWMEEQIGEQPQRQGESSWRYSINYGPEGEEIYAFVYDSHDDLVGNLKTHHAKAVVDAMNGATQQPASQGQACPQCNGTGVQGYFFNDKAQIEAEPCNHEQPASAAVAVDAKDALLREARELAISHLGLLKLNGMEDGVQETMQLIAAISEQAGAK